MKVYDSKEPSKFITYLDMNNLYVWAMSVYLPYGRFQWLKNVDGFDVASIGKKPEYATFLKLIFNILMNYMNYAMIIH